MQGWSPDFIPKLAEDAQTAKLVDEFVPVTGPDAMAVSKALAQKEGIFAGISSGATLAAALEVARRAPKGSKILAMLPDTGERYQSTPLFDDIPAEMTEEEVAEATKFSVNKVHDILDANINLTIGDIATLEIGVGNIVRDRIRAIEIAKS